MSQPQTFEDHYRQSEFAAFVMARRSMEQASYTITEVDKPAGDYSCPPLESVVVVLDRGRARSVVDLGAGKFRPVPGGISVVPPRSGTQVIVDNQHQIRFLAIPASKIVTWNEQADLGETTLDLGILHSRGFINPLVSNLAEFLWDVGGGNAPENALLADAALLTLWGALLKQGQRAFPTANKGGLAAWQLRRVTDYLAAHAGEEVRLGQLAALVDSSPFHFARAFKSTVGMPPYQYQRMLRLEKAKALLRTTDHSVTMIAFEVGYHSTQALSRLFRHVVGVSPSEYRRSFEPKAFFVAKPPRSER